MEVEAVFDCARGELLSPVKRLVGFEGEFPLLRRIVVTCRIIGLAGGGYAGDADDADRWDRLAAALYGPDGVYDRIVAQVGLALTIGVWGALTLRTAIWPGY